MRGSIEYFGLPNYIWQLNCPLAKSLTIAPPLWGNKIELLVKYFPIKQKTEKLFKTRFHTSVKNIKYIKDLPFVAIPYLKISTGRQRNGNL